MKPDNRSASIAKLVLAMTYLIIITMFAYHGTLENTFVYDTRHYLINTHIRELSWENVSWMFTSLEVWNWHPLTWYSWALDHWIYGGLYMPGFHLTNIILHGVNSAILFLVILVFLGLTRTENHVRVPVRLDDVSLIASFLASIIFAVHPQHVESVAWVAERKDLLCQMFVMLMFLAYMMYTASSDRARLKWYLTSLLLFVAAVMSKPMAVTMPAVLILMDVYPLRRTALLHPVFPSAQVVSYKMLIVEKLPFILVSSLVVWATLIAQASAMTAATHFSLPIRILNAFDSTIMYLSKVIIPINYSAFYPHLAHNAAGVTSQAWFSVIIFVILTMLSVYAWYRRSYVWLISWLFYLVTLLPVIGIVQVGMQGAADRYAYMTTLPFYVLIAAALLKYFQSHSINRRWGLSLAVLLACVALTSITIQQVRTWRDSISLWSHAISIDPSNGYVYSLLGGAFYFDGKTEAAAKYFAGAFHRRQLFITHLVPAALVFLQTENYELALKMHERIRWNADFNPRYKSNSDCLLYNEGIIYARLAKYEKAVDSFSAVSSDSILYRDANQWIETLGDDASDSSLAERVPRHCEDLAYVRRDWDLK